MPKSYSYTVEIWMAVSALAWLALIITANDTVRLVLWIVSGLVALARVATFVYMGATSDGREHPELMNTWRSPAALVISGMILLTTGGIMLGSMGLSSLGCYLYRIFSGSPPS